MPRIMSRTLKIGGVVAFLGLAAIYQHFFVNAFLVDTSRNFKGKIGNCDVVREQRMRYTSLYPLSTHTFEDTTAHCKGVVKRYTDAEPFGSLNRIRLYDSQGNEIKSEGIEQHVQEFEELYENMEPTSGQQTSRF
jgi:hypothetical protein